MQELPEELRSVAGQLLNSDAAHWWVRDVSKSFGSFDVEALYWIIDSEDKSIVVALRHDGSFASLAGAKALPLVSELIRKTFGAEPWLSIGAETLGKTIMAWYSDPRSYLTTPAFFEKQRAVLMSWLTGREKDPRVLQQVCREPILTSVGERWTLDFNAINRRGGIENWVARGTGNPFTITDVNVSVIKEDGSFNFPDEL